MSVFIKKTNIKHSKHSLIRNTNSIIGFYNYFINIKFPKLKVRSYSCDKKFTSFSGESPFKRLGNQPGPCLKSGPSYSRPGHLQLSINMICSQPVPSPSLLWSSFSAVRLFAVQLLELFPFSCFYLNLLQKIYE